MALEWKPMHLPLANGLQQKYDARSRPMPALDICRDAQFDEIGGLQTRYPFAAMSNAIYGGGTLANCRRIVANGDELLVFTDTQLYSWNAQIAKWVLRGTHLAIKVDEQTRFATTGDQVDPDRAELNGTIIVTWCEGTSGFAAAYDKTTGAMLMAPKLLSTATPLLRVVALSTRLVLFLGTTTNLFALSIDPADPVTSFGSSSTLILAAGTGLVFDAVRIGSTDTAFVVCRRNPTTSYQALKVTAAIAVTSVTVARTCTGPIAVCIDPAGANAQIFRANGTSIQGDLITVSTLATVGGQIIVGSALSTTINQIACEYANATTAFIFWTSGTAGELANGTDFTVETNSVTTIGAIGTQATLVHRLGIASRAFAYGGHVYLWLAFGGQSAYYGSGTASVFGSQLQNTYFLYREDGFLCAKADAANAGGFEFATGRLPGVALVDGSTGYAWCGVNRRVINVDANSTSYAARTPRDIVFAFDSNEARRCVRLGQTLYVSGGEILQYDGVQLTEVGVHIYPWTFAALAAAGGGSMALGSYAYKVTMRWDNARGEIDRSTTATVGVAIVGAGNNAMLITSIAALHVTHKVGVAAAAEIWRSLVNPTADAPFYLVTSKDPAATGGSNSYLANTPASAFVAGFSDILADSAAAARETNPENGAVLEALSPPAATIIKATDARVFLAGVAGDPDRVWYSRLRNAGEVASFNDTLTIDVPRVGGRITAVDFLNDTLIVFRETAVYAFGGDGFDNTGGAQNYGPARTVTSDVGAVSQEAVLLAPMGIVFKSRNGWHLLDVGWGAKYIGEKVSAFDADTVLAMHLVETQHHIRILTNNRVVFWDYYANQWGEWTVADGIDSTIWKGTHVYLTATGPKQQLATYTGLTYGMDAELTWIKPADLQGAIAVRWFELLGEFRSSCLVRMRVARDYQYDGAGNVVYFDDFSWSPSPAVVGSALQVRHSPSIQKVEAFKVRITAAAPAGLGSLNCTSLNVLTSGTVWDAGWLTTALGVSGNAVTMSLAFEDGSPFSIDVRDHFAWSHTLQRWTEDLNNVGVKVTCRAGSSPTVAQLDAAIAAGSRLIEIDTADTTPAKVINAAAMVNLTRTGAFAGGSYGTPTGEAIKLTGLGLEVGAQQGLYRRLPAAQKA